MQGCRQVGAWGCWSTPKFWSLLPAPSLGTILFSKLFFLFTVKIASECISDTLKSQSFLGACLRTPLTTLVATLPAAAYTADKVAATPKLKILSTALQCRAAIPIGLWSQGSVNLHKALKWAGEQGYNVLCSSTWHTSMIFGTVMLWWEIQYGGPVMAYGNHG